MNEEELIQIKRLIEEEFNKREAKILHQSQFVAKMVKQRHIDGMIIIRGLAADLPDDDATGVQAYFGTDDDTLYIWNGDAWVSEILT